jgi:predicted nucleic acid-binding protein
MAVELPKFVLDTNIALYHLGNRLGEPLPSGVYFISIITEMELLAYPSLSESETRRIYEFLGYLKIVNIDDSIKTLAIQLRKESKLKLPDAIIVATAISLEAVLLTNDTKLTKLSSLEVQSIPLS